MSDRTVYIIGDDGLPISVALNEVLYNDKISGTHTKYYNSYSECTNGN